MESVLILTNLSQMCYDNEASVKIHDTGLQTLLRTLMNFHPLRRNPNHFEEIKPTEADSACDDFVLYIFRTLRCMFSLERNRKVI